MGTTISYETNIVSCIPHLISLLPLLHLQVKAEAELEQAQRVTQDKKLAMHEELLRKATAKEVGGASRCGHDRHGTGMLLGLC